MTKTPPILTLFDYGVGNLHSIRKALERSGATVIVTRDPQDLLDAQALVLPGVGAFGATMEPLLEIREELRARLVTGTPCLAVCIGMQLLFEESEESPGVPGIGLLAGRVRRLPTSVGKIPHMGWNTVDRAPGAEESAGLAPGLPSDGTHVYYVHSYYAEPAQPRGVLLKTRYGEQEGVTFPAAIIHRNTLAVQFHPEKSSGQGLRLIAAWVEATRDVLQKARHGRNIDTPTEGSGTRPRRPASPSGKEQDP
jgi:imidazole glycerol-phosphate synthase subunit HisH